MMRIILFFCVCMMPFCEAENVNTQDLKGLQYILRKYNIDITGLAYGMKQNLELLKDVQEYINEDGLGPSSKNVHPCVGYGWVHFTSSRCIKILDELKTYDDALDACDKEFKSGRDKQLPELIAIPTAEINARIVKVLENVSFVSSIWVDNEVSDYSNFGNTSQMMLGCIELVNDGSIRGQWFRVECEKENSVICEKPVSVNYTRLVQEQIEFITEITKSKHIARGIIQKDENTQKRFNATLESFVKRQSEYILSLKNSSMTSEKKMTENILINSENVLANSYSLLKLTETHKWSYQEIKEQMQNLKLDLKTLLTKNKMKSVLAKIDREISRISENIEKNAEEADAKYKHLETKMDKKFEALDNRLRGFIKLPVITSTRTPNLDGTLPPVVSDSVDRELEATVAASLPHQLLQTATIYDGNDSIYIFGGYARNEIYRFNISSNEIEQIGTLPGNLYGGGIAKDTLGNIFYFGGSSDGNYSNRVLKFDIKRNTIKEVARLQGGFYNSYAFKSEENSNIVFLIGSTGGKGNYVQSFDMISQKVSKISLLKRNYTFAYTLVHGLNALIFSFASSTVEILNLETLTSVLQTTRIPPLQLYPTVVSDGNFGYIFGGYNNTFSAKTIMRFNPVTFEHDFVPVKNFPVKMFHWESAVYVEKLKSIYLTGGYSEDSIFSNKICYIVLSNSQEPRNTAHDFQCAEKTNGFHVHPNSKERFISCLNGAAQTFSCPTSLVFDDATSSCTYPPEVASGWMNCNNKTNGMYPHPKNCGMFIGCQDGFMDIFKCPISLKFDGVLKKCTFPEISRCDSTIV